MQGAPGRDLHAGRRGACEAGRRPGRRPGPDPRRASENIQFEDDEAERENHNNYSGSNLEKHTERRLREKHKAVYDALVERPTDLTTMDGMADYGRPLSTVRALTARYAFTRTAIPSTTSTGASNWRTNTCIYRGDVFLELTEDHLLYKGERRPKDQERNEWAKQPHGATIEERPPEIRARGTFGNWEMDSIMGTQGSNAALLVLTERMTRQGIIIWVPDHTTDSVVRALNRIEQRLGKKFREVFRTITVDNGSEFADCEGMERSYRLKRPRTKIYYCHPYSPQERGSNENMNRIIRRFFPKGTNFDEVTPAEVARAELWMNNYPRRILGWKSSSTLFMEYMAA